jgi:hypothetical protein
VFSSFGTVCLLALLACLLACSMLLQPNASTISKLVSDQVSAFIILTVSMLFPALLAHLHSEGTLWNRRKRYHCPIKTTCPCSN